MCLNVIRLTDENVYAVTMGKRDSAGCTVAGLCLSTQVNGQTSVTGLCVSTQVNGQTCSHRVVFVHSGEWSDLQSQGCVCPLG